VSAKTTTKPDRELMRYLDGDLDEAPRLEMERALESDPDARAKLAGMALAGDLLREQVDADDRGDSIVDAVMAKLDATDAGATKEAEKASEVAAEVAPDVVPFRKMPAKPANDNARTIWAVTGLAAAAAAALFFWGKTEPDRDLAVAPPPATQQAEPPVAPPPEEAHASAEAREQADAEEAEEDRIEVAAVDFGDRSGSVFYTSAGSRTGSSAVVWVNDGGKR
jgi:hypothetical protein